MHIGAADEEPVWDFQVDRADPAAHRLVRHMAPPSLAEGEVLVEVTSLAFSANTTTYITLGEEIDYWGFFPAAGNWGRFPAWGIGRVIASSNSGLRVGERVFGFLPPSSHLVLRPAALGRDHFMDAAPHRRPLHPAYNYYVRLDYAPHMRAMQDNWLTLLRPLFMASFLLDCHLADENWFGGEIVVTSASSKTALGFALRHRANGRNAPPIAGVTSARNLAFVNATGLFDRVLEYGDLPEAGLGAITVADFAGNPDLAPALDMASAGNIRQWITIGATHRSEIVAAADRVGMVRNLFFTPDHIRTRMGQEGAESFERRLTDALMEFQAFMKPRLIIREWHGPEALAELYARTLTGDLPADEGHILYPA